MGFLTYIKVIVFFIFLFSIGFTGYYFYKMIYSYSYVSMISACEVETFKSNYPNAIITGYFVVNSSEENTTSSIVVKNEDDMPTIIHEQCHEQQYNQKRLFSCNHKILRVINEIECYSKQRAFEINYS